MSDYLNLKTINISVSGDHVIITPPAVTSSPGHDESAILANVHIDRHGRIHIANKDFAARVRGNAAADANGMTNTFCGGGGKTSSNTYCHDSKGTNAHCKNSPEGTNTTCS